MDLKALIARYTEQLEAVQKAISSGDYMVTKLAAQLEQERSALLINQTTQANLQVILNNLKELEDAVDPAESPVHYSD